MIIRDFFPLSFRPCFAEATRRRRERAWVRLALFSIFFANVDSVCSQPFATIREYEAVMQQKFEQSLLSSPDSVKAGLHKDIEELFAGALIIPGAFDYPFDSLKKVGKITSRDGKLRIFTWDFMRNDGSHHYYGFMLCRRKNPENPLPVKLTDCSESIMDPTLQVLDPDTWFGALYYEIVERKWNNKTLYTLLGYDPNDIFTSRKVIDCFYLKDGLIPVFGAPLFVLNNKVQHRIIFEYSAKVGMSLRYNESLKMIVFDHLSPAKPSYTGNYQFYGPDFSYDALKFTENFWVLFEDVNVRNPE
ncbi:MAG: hypothetical protein JW973_04550 [Bacteroidales bacterium]|nr:hypothetical protein [Bacteroidales bacterium]